MEKKEGCSQVARLTVRVPKEIHEDIIACAALKNKPVNRLIMDLLTDAVGKMTTSKSHPSKDTLCEPDIIAEEVVQDTKRAMYIFRQSERNASFSSWDELLKSVDQLPLRGYIYRRGKELSSVLSIISFKKEMRAKKRPLRYRDFIAWRNGYGNYFLKLRDSIKHSGPSQLVSFRIHTEIMDIINQIAEEYSFIAGKQCGTSHILRNVIYRSLQTLDLDKPDLSPVPLAIRRVQKRLSEEDISGKMVFKDKIED